MRPDDIADADDDRSDDGDDDYDVNHNKNEDDVVVDDDWMAYIAFASVFSVEYYNFNIYMWNWHYAKFNRVNTVTMLTGIHRFFLHVS